MSWIDAYQAIEARTGFAIPELLRRMHAHGATGDRITREEWLKARARRALHDPPALLGASDFAWLKAETMANWRPPANWKTELVFIPFAETGAGDPICFYPAWTENGATPVVLTLHDGDRCFAKAPHLEGYLFAQMLEALAVIDKHSFGTWSEAQLRQSFRANIKALAPYLRWQWTAFLEACVDRPLIGQQQPVGRQMRRIQALISQAELNEIVARELAFGHTGASFNHAE
jgi:hypothetical protein